MRFIFAVFCIVFSLFAQEVKIASYNVENLFDEINQGSEYRDFTLGQNGWSKKMARIKYKNTLDAIGLIGADILALQEVENKALMSRLAKDGGFACFAFTKAKKAPVGLGVLSKYPIKFQENIYAGTRRTRDFLHVRIDINGKELGIWNVHFPTMKHSFVERLRVAKTLAKAIKKSKDKEFLILGDFNTKISSNSILKKVFGSLNSQKSFYDAWNFIPSSQRYSQVFYGRKSALDRIILNKNMFDKKGFDYKKGSFKVINNSFLSSNGKPNRWRSKNRRHLGKGYSDHFPIMLSISDEKNPHDSFKKTNLSIEELYKLKAGDVDVEIKKAVVIYKDKFGVIISQNGRGIYIYKPNIELKKFYMYDFLVKHMKDYKGLREIDLLQVNKEYGIINKNDKYFINQNQLKTAKPSDVVGKIGGVVDGRYLLGDFGRIRIFSRNKRLKDGQKIQLEEVRVGKYKGELELIVEDRE